jgi:hypothetical protein
MKTAILVVLVFCATAAFCQASGPVGAVLQNEPVVLQLPSHSEHASAVPLAIPQYLNGPSGSTSAQGTKPLWEFPVSEESVSLGEIARQLRQEHLLAKKADKVLTDQR